MTTPQPRRSAFASTAAVILIALGWGAASVLHAAPVSTPHVRAELVAEKSAIAPGETAWVALHLTMKEGWHTYWKHPGDSGEPTTIDWQLPEGFTAGDIQWPYPQKISMAPLTTYGYEGEVMLIVPITAPADAVPGTTSQLGAGVYWMVCEEVCIPEEVTLGLELPIGDNPVPPEGPSSTSFEQTRLKVPATSDGWNIQAAERDDRLVLRAQPPAGIDVAGQDITFFATAGQLIEYSAPESTSIRDGIITMELVRSPYLIGSPERMSGVLVAKNGWGGSGPGAIEFDVPFGAIAASAAPAAASTLSSLPSTLWIALALAFVGGILLNLMPCVFPVVSLKILGFVQSSGDEPRRVRIHGLAFAAGVLVAFWILAGLLLLLRAAGQEIGWGFQLQSSGFVAFMSFLLFGLGLSLAGVVDIGTSLTRVGGSSGQGGYRTSVMNGMLATVVATPCTAPFMGAALGYAMTQSAGFSMLVFTALGAGMAAPYVALSAWPALMRFLPRPGAWMVRFKQLMAFPLFATVAWLVWVFGHQAGIDGVLRLLLGLTALAAGLWIWGQWGTPSSTRVVKAAAITGFALLLAGGLALAVTSRPVSASEIRTNVASGIEWEAYSRARVAEHRAAGRPVFIDFTAAWCLTCKVNERIAFSSREVQNLVRERGIAMLKADWTNRDPEITRALEEFGRSGVPLYVLYNADPNAQARLLPEILSPGILINALSEVEGPK